MGFLTKAAREEDSTDEGGQLEEQYMKLFPKMGRDFVHREDFVVIIRQVLAIVDPAGLNPVNLDDDSEARERAKEYKAYIDEDKKGSDVYKDLIKLDEDDEEEEAQDA